MDFEAAGLTVAALTTAVDANLPAFVPIALFLGAVGIAITAVARVKRKIIRI